MEDRARLRFQDILDSIEQLEQIFGGTTYPEFVADRIRRAACERFLEIISEASRHLPDALKAQAPQIPWKNIADIGNHLRHAYHRIDADILWQVHASGQLADLRDVVLTMQFTYPPQ